MELTKDLLNDLLLTKAMSDYAMKEERFDSLNDVLDEVFADGALDRDSYFTSVMKLTQLGYVASDIENEEDIELSEAVGYDIEGVTAEGMEYINSLYNKPKLGDKIKNYFKEFDNICRKIADSGAGKLTGSIILKLIGLF